MQSLLPGNGQIKWDELSLGDNNKTGNVLCRVEMFMFHYSTANTFSNVVDPFYMNSPHSVGAANEVKAAETVVAVVHFFSVTRVRHSLETCYSKARLASHCGLGADLVLLVLKIFCLVEVERALLFRFLNSKQVSVPFIRFS